jgi:hypothetical protein
MTKYYLLAVVGAAFAAAAESWVVLAFTTAITILLMQMENEK